MTCEEVKKLVQQHFAGVEVLVEDLTGSGDHFKVIVVSDVFAGEALVKRHQRVHKALAEPLRGPLHALTIETYTKSEWQDRRHEESPKPRPMPQQIKL